MTRSMVLGNMTVFCGCGCRMTPLRPPAGPHTTLLAPCQVLSSPQHSSQPEHLPPVAVVKTLGLVFFLKFLSSSTFEPVFVFSTLSFFFSLTMISSYLLLNSASVRGAIWLRETGPDIVASSASGGLSRCRPVPASWLSLSPPSALADGLYPHSCRWLLHCKSPVFIPDQKKEGTRRKYWYLYEEVSEIPQRTYAYFQLVRSTSHTHP